MATVAHLAAGLALSRLAPPGTRPFAAVLLAAAAVLPDADIVGHYLGVPYGEPLGHRGVTHSLAFALTCGLVAAIVGGRRWGVLVGAAVATHPLLDAACDGGRGVPALWPFSSERFFLPWRPIRVAPIGWAFFTARGLRAALTEVWIVIPCLAIALWPITRTRTRPE